jgi:hypothetical protein
LLSNFSHAEEGALLGIPGKVIFESKFDSELPKDWQSAKGKWEIVEGAMRGSEKPEDMHGAVNRMPGKLGDFIAEYEFKFEGAKSTSLSINGPKDHQARIAITPKSVTIQKDDSDHAGPDKPVVFARFAGDEFVVLLPGEADVAVLDARSRRIISALEAPCSTAPSIIKFTTTKLIINHAGPVRSRGESPACASAPAIVGISIVGMCTVKSAPVKHVRTHPISPRTCSQWRPSV